MPDDKNLVQFGIDAKILVWCRHACGDMFQMMFFTCFEDKL